MDQIGKTTMLNYIANKLSEFDEIIGKKYSLTLKMIKTKLDNVTIFLDHCHITYDRSNIIYIHCCVCNNTACCARGEPSCGQRWDQRWENVGENQCVVASLLFPKKGNKIPAKCRSVDSERRAGRSGG